jgi:hypothetical protein
MRALVAPLLGMLLLLLAIFSVISAAILPVEAKLQQFEAAVPLARDLLALISQRYEYDTPLGRAFLLMQSNINEQDYEHLKYSLALKMLTNEESTYLMVIGCALFYGIMYVYKLYIYTRI